MADIKKEAKICGIIAIIFLIGFYFRFMIVGSRMGPGIVMYENYPEGFLFWSFIWFGVILSSLVYMHNLFVQEQNKKHVLIVRVLIAFFILISGWLAIPYFK